MRPDNLRKKERLSEKAFKKAEERKKKGYFEGAALAFLEAAKLLPEDKYPEHVAACFNNAGNAFRRAQKYIQAEDYLQRALTIREKIFGKEHPDTAKTIDNLGCVYCNKGDFDKAEEYHHRALTIRKKTLENNHPDIAKSLNNLGSLYADKGELDDAYKYFQLAKDSIENYPLEINNLDTKIITKNHHNAQEEINRLELEKLEIQAALYQSKKLDYLGQMATMMAHNINQPIAVIRMATSGALSDVNDNLFDPTTELKPLLEKIHNQTERLSQIMNNFRLFARGDRTVLSAVNLNAVIEDIYQLLFAAQYQLDKIGLQKDLIASPIAHANELAIQEMLISLLSNARAAVKDKPVKQVCIRTWQQEGQVGFAVEDNGEGITKENLPKLFTPFLSSKNEGMGLGLYFCREIAKDLGGSIEYYPAPLGGAGFKITLPVQQENPDGSPI
ncbi:MAG: tetratricopeptide repeat protein [Methylobacter sp.]|nr:tetratricopeptide repeat protein [Methylobacter sp.]